MIQEKSCGIIIYRLESSLMYLLLRYRQGHWDFVKGKMEPEENEKETALREAEEETNIHRKDLIFHHDFKEEISYAYQKNRKTIHKEVIFFLAQTTSFKIFLSNEHIDFIWLPFKEAEEKLTFQNAKRVLREANNILKKKYHIHPRRANR